MLDNKPVYYFQGQLRMEFLYSDKGELKGFWINDFLTKIKNKGYGSMLLGEALWYIARTLGTDLKFKGCLSFVDEGNPENHKRRNHIYQKFGFTIVGDKIHLEKIPLEVIIQEREKWNK